MLSRPPGPKDIQKMPHFMFYQVQKHAILNGLDQNCIKTMDSESR